MSETATAKIQEVHRAAAKWAVGREQEYIVDRLRRYAASLYLSRPFGGQPDVETQATIDALADEVRRIEAQ